MRVGERAQFAVLARARTRLAGSDYPDDDRSRIRRTVMVLGNATEQSESGEFGPAEEFVAMDLFNKELVEAGVMLAADGLQPSSKGKRVAFNPDGSTTVIDGPFAETKEPVAGFMI